jgi:hypothetical protein
VTDITEPNDDENTGNSELMPPGAKEPAMFTDDELRGMDSWEAAMAAVTEAHGGVAVADEELGTGFGLLESDDKARLIGVPCLFVEWRFNPGAYGEPFVSAGVIAKIPGGIARYIVNDGSTGIRDQLQSFTERTGKRGGLYSAKGLRRSDYTKMIWNDKLQKEVETPATTFYIDTAPDVKTQA